MCHVFIHIILFLSCKDLILILFFRQENWVEVAILRQQLLQCHLVGSSGESAFEIVKRFQNEDYQSDGLYPLLIENNLDYRNSDLQRLENLKSLLNENQVRFPEEQSDRDQKDVLFNEGISKKALREKSLNFPIIEQNSGGDRNYKKVEERIVGLDRQQTKSLLTDNFKFRQVSPDVNNIVNKWKNKLVRKDLRSLKNVQTKNGHEGLVKQRRDDSENKGSKPKFSEGQIQEEENLLYSPISEPNLDYNVRSSSVIPKAFRRRHIDSSVTKLPHSDDPRLLEAMGLVPRTSKRLFKTQRRFTRDTSPEFLTAHPSQTTTTVTVPENFNVSIEPSLTTDRKGEIGHLEKDKNSSETSSNMRSRRPPSLFSTKYYRSLLNRRLRSSQNTSLPYSEDRRSVDEVS